MLYVLNLSVSRGFMSPQRADYSSRQDQYDDVFVEQYEVQCWRELHADRRLPAANVGLRRGDGAASSPQRVVLLRELKDLVYSGKINESCFVFEAILFTPNRCFNEVRMKENHRNIFRYRPRPYLVGSTYVCTSLYLLGGPHGRIAAFLPTVTVMRLYTFDRVVR